MTAKAPVLYRWDLDKTYLRTDFDRLRDLARVPFQSAAEKVDLPGAVELLRALRETARSAGREIRIYFISASPPQLSRAILEKFRLDGVEIDGIAFKDQLQILMRGRLRGLREQTGFKLSELLRGRLEVSPDAPEYLFGDDWETDPIIYSLYGDVLAGRVDFQSLGEVLEAIPVEPEWRARIEELVPKLVPADPVRRIFIRLERRTPPGEFRVFGPKLVPAFDYFQTAACLFEDGQLDVPGVERVGRALIEREGYSREMLENSLEDILRRGHLGVSSHRALTEELRRRDLLPWRRLSVGQRLRIWWRRRREPTPQPRRLAPGPVPDYRAIVAQRRSER
jgi:hypothetical protein